MMLAPTTGGEPRDEHNGVARCLPSSKGSIAVMGRDGNSLDKRHNKQLEPKTKT